MIIKRIYSCRCKLGITSKEITVEEITEQLGIYPHRCYRKGDVFYSKTTGRNGKKIYNLWEVCSKSICLDSPDINVSLDELRGIFKEKYDILQNFKKDTRCDVSIWIWIETNELAMELNIKETNLCFLDLVNWMHLSFISANRNVLE